LVNGNQRHASRTADSRGSGDDDVRASGGDDVRASGGDNRVREEVQSGRRSHA
jgi:hypothetical protein